MGLLHLLKYQLLSGTRIRRGIKAVAHLISPAFYSNECLKVDLQYPRRSKTSTTTGSSLQPAEKELSKPSFSEVLASSLRAEGETRAWFNDQLKYQYVRQTRQPLGFPRVSHLLTKFRHL